MIRARHQSAAGVPEVPRVSWAHIWAHFFGHTTLGALWTQRQENHPGNPHPHRASGNLKRHEHSPNKKGGHELRPRDTKSNTSKTQGEAPTDHHKPSDGIQPIGSGKAGMNSTAMSGCGCMGDPSTAGHDRQSRRRKHEQSLASHRKRLTRSGASPRQGRTSCSQ